MILVDTSVLFAYFSENDSCYSKAREVYDKLVSREILILEDVIKELLTVVTLKVSKKLANQVYCELVSDSRDVSVYHLDALEFFDFMNAFAEEGNEKLSIVDLELLYLAKKYQFKVLTFDKGLIKALPRELVS